MTCDILSTIDVKLSGWR